MVRGAHRYIAGGDVAGTQRFEWGSLDGSIVGENAPTGFLWSSIGLYQFHFRGQLERDFIAGGANQRFSSTVNAPVGFGNALLTMALEDNTTDSSPYGNTMTANNSPGTVAAVFGNGYSSTVNSYLSHTDSGSDFNNITCATDVGGYMHFWFKTASTTNPAADAELVAVDRSTGADAFRMYISTQGYLVGYFYDTATASNPVGNVDFADAEWHHVVWTVDCGDNLGSMYVDGVLHVSAAYTGTVGLGLNVVQIGAKEGPSGYFDGFIDDVVIGAGTVSAESAAKLYAEGRKKLGMGTPVFTRTPDDALLSNNVVEVDALDNGMWAVAFSDANTVQVFDGRIPIQQIAAPAGTVKSIALIQSPGTDSVGVAIGTTTNLKFVQPSVNLREAMAHQYKEPIHVGSSVVVDSAGIGGIFWTANDALDAGLNAGVGEVFVLGGSYGPVVMDQAAMTLRCGSPKWTLTSKGTLFKGDGTNAALHTSNGGGQIIENCGFYSAPGGAGGGAHAVRLGGGGDPKYGMKFRYNFILDADDACINMNENGGNGQGQVYNNTIQDCDGIGIDTGSASDGINIVDNHVTSGGTGIQLISGANVNVVVGNATDSGITDGGSGNIVTGNVQY